MKSIVKYPYFTYNQKVIVYFGGYSIYEIDSTFPEPYYSLSDVAYRIGYGRNKFYAYLRFIGWINQKNNPTKEAQEYNFVFSIYFNNNNHSYMTQTGIRQLHWIQSHNPYDIQYFLQ